MLINSLSGFWFIQARTGRSGRSFMMKYHKNKAAFDLKSGRTHATPPSFNFAPPSKQTAFVSAADAPLPPVLSSSSNGSISSTSNGQHKPISLDNTASTSVPAAGASATPVVGQKRPRAVSNAGARGDEAYSTSAAIPLAAPVRPLRNKIPKRNYVEPEDDVEAEEESTYQYGINGYGTRKLGRPSEGGLDGDVGMDGRYEGQGAYEAGSDGGTYEDVEMEDGAGESSSQPQYQQAQQQQQQYYSEDQDARSPSGSSVQGNGLSNGTGHGSQGKMEIESPISPTSIPLGGVNGAGAASNSNNHISNNAPTPGHGPALQLTPAYPSGSSSASSNKPSYGNAIVNGASISGGHALGLERGVPDPVDFANAGRRALGNTGNSGGGASSSGSSPRVVVNGNELPNERLDFPPYTGTPVRGQGQRFDPVRPRHSLPSNSHSHSPYSRSSLSGASGSTSRSTTYSTASTAATSRPTLRMASSSTPRASFGGGAMSPGPGAPNWMSEFTAEDKSAALTWVLTRVKPDGLKENLASWIEFAEGVSCLVLFLIGGKRCILTVGSVSILNIRRKSGSVTTFSIYRRLTASRLISEPLGGYSKTNELCAAVSASSSTFGESLCYATGLRRRL